MSSNEAIFLGIIENELQQAHEMLACPDYTFKVNALDRIETMYDILKQVADSLFPKSEKHSCEEHG